MTHVPGVADLFLVPYIPSTQLVAVQEIPDGGRCWSLPFLFDNPDNLEVVTPYLILVASCHLQASYPVYDLVAR